MLETWLVRALAAALTTWCVWKVISAGWSTPDNVRDRRAEGEGR